MYANNATPESLLPALRQYRSTSESAELLPGFDYTLTCELVETLEARIAELEAGHQPAGTALQYTVVLLYPEYIGEGETYTQTLEATSPEQAVETAREQMREANDWEAGEQLDVDCVALIEGGTPVPVPQAATRAEGLTYHALARGIPRHCVPGVVAYVEKGQPPGGFLRAVLENNLVEAAARADDTNQERLYNYAMFLHNFAPTACWGSPEAVRSWTIRHNRGAK